MARRCFLPLTERLTLAIVLPPQQPLDVLGVAPGDLCFAAQTARAGRGLVLEQVVSVGVPAHDLAGAGDLEALGRAAVRLHLGHDLSLAVSVRRERASTATAPSPGACELG